MAGAKAYTVTDAERILGSAALCRYGGNGSRNRALFVTGITTGCRVSELVRIRLEDVIDVYGNFKTDLRIWQIKTEKYRNVPLSNGLFFRYVPIWIEELRRRVIMRDKDWLFPGERGNHLCERTVQRILEAVHFELKMVGYSTHSMRKSWAVEIYRGLVNANRTGKICADPFEKLRELGGWESYDSCRKYISDMVDNRREVVAGIFPGLYEGVVMVSEKEKRNTVSTGADNEGHGRTESDK